MQIYSYLIVFPEGETQEIEGSLPINALVDMNGRELELPLRSHRIIAYRVVKMRTSEERGETKRYFFLELVGADELMAYVG
jgi:hypothetical protein